MMGSGKSTIGRLVSEETGWPLYDNDDLLMSLHGMTARELLSARGEEAMRAAEDAALAHGLNRPSPHVVDAAAGTILSAESRAALREPVVIWLRALPETLFRRAAGAEHRPWLADGETWMRETSALRDPLYASVADIVIDTDGRTPTDVADAAIEAIKRLCRDSGFKEDT